MGDRVYYVSGANRGLGLEFVRELAVVKGNTIVATVRSLSNDLGDLKAVSSLTTHILECDTSNVDSIRSFANEAAKLLNGRKIDFLLNVAGINYQSQQSSLDLTSQALALQMQVNVIGPAKTTESLLAAKALSPNVRILNMTSGLASMTKSLGIKPRKCMGYSISKAGLNMLTVHQSDDLKTKGGLSGVVVIAMDPGWVKTRMGGDGAILTPEESIGGMLKVLDGLVEKDNGKFFNYDGSAGEW